MQGPVQQFCVLGVTAQPRILVFLRIATRHTSDTPSARIMARTGVLLCWVALALSISFASAADAADPIRR